MSVGMDSLPYQQPRALTLVDQMAIRQVIIESRSGAAPGCNTRITNVAKQCPLLSRRERRQMVRDLTKQGKMAGR